MEKALKIIKGFFYFYTMKKTIIYFSLIVLTLGFSCGTQKSAVEKRKQKLEKKKKRNPNDCPKVDC